MPDLVFTINFFKDALEADGLSGDCLLLAGLMLLVPLTAEHSLVDLLDLEDLMVALTLFQAERLRCGLLVCLIQVLMND